MQMFRQGGPREHGPAVHPLKKNKKRTRPTSLVVQLKKVIKKKPCSNSKTQRRKTCRHFQLTEGKC